MLAYEAWGAGKEPTGTDTSAGRGAPHSTTRVWLLTASRPDPGQERELPDFRVYEGPLFPGLSRSVRGRYRGSGRGLVLVLFRAFLMEHVVQGQIDSASGRSRLARAGRPPWAASSNHSPATSLGKTSARIADESSWVHAVPALTIAACLIVWSVNAGA